MADGLNKDRKSYIHTFTGKWIDPFDPDPESICIEDIAHALSLQCRFTGHVKHLWTVAQHSLLVSQILTDAHLDTFYRFWGLMHDASEAYLIDVARPVKHLPAFQSYREAEAQIMSVICTKYGLPQQMPPIVHEADNLALSIEAHALMHDVTDWNLSKPLTGYVIGKEDPSVVEWKFKVAFWEMCNG